MGSIKRWTPAEYKIIRACSSISESMTRLPERTEHAIKGARKRLRVGQPYHHWTKAENGRLRKHSHEPLSKLARRFKNRTSDAVRTQRALLIGPVRTLWKTTELAKLKKLYPSATRNELLFTFPHRTWQSIKHQAEHFGCRRAGRLSTAPNELREAVRARAQEDGIPLCQLGAQTGCGGYFQNRQSKTVDLNKIARAVDFFGGKLVIAWRMNSEGHGGKITAASRMGIR
ncbi:MAG TPA: hypothetical protein VGO49_17260 [Bradyrhizobium sp.]|nr:hypothetical protein [Bradyrhizobium sp.]